MKKVFGITRSTGRTDGRTDDEFSRLWDGEKSERRDLWKKAANEELTPKILSYACIKVQVCVVVLRIPTSAENVSEYKKDVMF